MANHGASSESRNLLELIEKKMLNKHYTLDRGPSLEIVHWVPVQVSAGQFTIFFPEDGHVPSCAWGESAEVLKMVVKMRV